MKSLAPLTALVIGFWATAGFAARLASGGIYRLPETDLLPQDLYFGGSSLRLEGRLEGSVLAACQSANIRGRVTRNAYLACQTIDLSGTVGGDLNALCATLSVTGPVVGALRAGSGLVYINNTVGQDVLAGSSVLVIGPEAEIRGDLIAGCSTLEIQGVVRGDVRVSASEVTITGTVDGDVEVVVDRRLQLGDDARIFGSLRYISDRKLDLGNEDAVFGSIVRISPFPAGPARAPQPRRLFPALPHLLTFLSLLAALLTGFIILAVWRGPVTQALDSTLKSFGRTIGYGALGFFATPLAALAALIFVVTIPAVLITLAAYLAAVYLAKLLTGMFLGRWFFRLVRAPDVPVWLSAPVGIVIIYSLCAIPRLGWLIWLFAALLGFGIVLRLLARTRVALPADRC
ncbi:MAG: polymer-forming cytoskeletal protein [candidate division WOR-3 bacterium]